MLMKSLLAGSVLLLSACEAAAQTADTWRWSKAMTAGKTLEVRGVMGDITATPASGGQVEIVATKRARRGNAAEVRFEVVEHDGSYTICALYSDDSECGDGSRGRKYSNNNHKNDTRVDFEVRVPRGVRFTGRSVTGNVEATGMTADVTGASVSGDVHIRTTGLARATSVSGSLDVGMGRTDWDGTLSFTTVSGDIVLVVPDSLDTNVRFTTVSGDLDSDWPITATGKIGRGQIHGRIGSGGRDLKFSTVSGDVELRKAQK